MLFLFSLFIEYIQHAHSVYCICLSQIRFFLTKKTSNYIYVRLIAIFSFVFHPMSNNVSLPFLSLSKINWNLIYISQTTSFFNIHFCRCWALIGIQLMNLRELKYIYSYMNIYVILLDFKGICINIRMHLKDIKVDIVY